MSNCYSCKYFDTPWFGNTRGCEIYKEGSRCTYKKSTTSNKQGEVNALIEIVAMGRPYVKTNTKYIQPLDFVRLINPLECNIISNVGSHIGMVKEINNEGQLLVIWIGKTYNKNAWFDQNEVELIDNLANLLTRELMHPFGNNRNKEEAEIFYPLKRIGIRGRNL